MLLNADVVKGREAEPVIERLLADLPGITTCITPSEGATRRAPVVTERKDAKPALGKPASPRTRSFGDGEGGGDRVRVSMRRLGGAEAFEIRVPREGNWQAWIEPCSIISGKLEANRLLAYPASEPPRFVSGRRFVYWP
jgi:hypothetical protein